MSAASERYIARRPPTGPLPGFDHIRRYRDATGRTRAARLCPGEYYVTCGDELIATTLGSCVATCIRDPIAGVGGMNHFMLPVHPGSTSDRRSALEEASWGGYAMEALINEILKYGGRRGRLEIKVFGAARILAGMTDVGAKNILFVQAYLRDEGLKLVSADLGGVRPRRIRYSARTGRAGVQKLPALQSNEIIRQEHAHLEHILRRSSRSDIELF